MMKMEIYEILSELGLVRASKWIIFQITSDVFIPVCSL